MLDKNYQYVNDDAFGYTQIPANASFSQQQMSIPDIIINKEGYIFVYVSYESQVHNRVYFDDLQVRHHQSKVIQSNNYYPFGLQHNTSWTRPAEQLNNRLYNSGAELNEQTKNYETFYRDYDPTLGRFNQIDPLASSFGSITPYNYAFNDPVALNDPNGDCPSCEFWDEVYKRLEDLGSSGATSWTPGGGWNDMSQEDAFAAGWNYNTQHNSWGNIDGGQGGAAQRFADSMGGTAYQDNNGNYNIVYNTNHSYVQTDQSGNPIENGAWGGTSSYDVLSLDGIENEGTGSNDNSSDYWTGVGVGVNSIFAAGIEIGTSPGQRPRYWGPNDFKNASKVGKGFARKLSLLGFAVATYQAIDDPSAGKTVDAVFAGIGLVPGYGWAIGGTYFGADLITIGITGQGIGEHIDNHYWIPNPTGLGFIPIGKKSK